MVLTLLAITFVSAAAVGTIYEITQEPIAAAKSAKIGSAVALVVPPFDNNPDETKTIDSLDGKTVTVYTALSGQDTVGYAIETFSNSGFGGEIRLMVGFLPDGTIHRVETLSHNDPPVRLPRSHRRPTTIRPSSATRSTAASRTSRSSSRGRIPERSGWPSERTEAM